MNSVFDPKDYWERRLESHPGLEGVGYLALGPYYNFWLYKIKALVFRNHVLRLGVRRDWKVLDVGSGSGFFLALWKSLGLKNVTGSDFSDTAVRRLKYTFPEFPIVQLDIGNPLNANISDGPFDIVTAFDVLYHIVDEEKYARAVANIARLCAKGGHFIFSENCLHSRTTRHPHQVSRSLERIIDILTHTGFRLIKRSPMFYVMNEPVDTKRAWAWPLWDFFMHPVRILKPLGFVYGAVLFPIEYVLTSMLAESPTTEIIVCRKL